MEKQNEKPMEPIQMSRLLTWLDEEHRKDKTELQFLREKLAAQTAVLDSQAAQLRDLAAQVAAFKGQTTRLATLEEGLSQTKGQIGQLKEQQDRHQEETARAIALRKSEIEHLLKARVGLEQRLEAVARDAVAPVARLQALSEDFKRIMAILPQLEAVRQQVTALAARLPGFETEDRRSSDRITALERIAEDVKNGQVRIQEEHRLAAEEQKHLIDEFNAQAQALQRRFEERTASIQHFVAERSKDQEAIITLQAQLDALRQAQQGMDARLARLEDQDADREAGYLRLQDAASQLQQDLTRLSHLQAATDRHLADDLPSLRKLTADLDSALHELRDQMAEMLLEHQREREALGELQKELAMQLERYEATIGSIIEFQEQTLREQANALHRRIQDAQRLTKPAVGTD